MSAQIIDGAQLALKMRQRCKENVYRLHENGITVGLTVIIVGNNPASEVYVKNKIKVANEAGMRSDLLRLPSNASNKELLEAIHWLNQDPDVHGILVQLPLPPHIDAEQVTKAITPSKDVDGFHAEHLGALVLGKLGFIPCTPAGVMVMLGAIRFPTEGCHAVIVGRSNIVGKPMALLLLQAQATVTVCHSRTRDLPSITRQADLLIAAVGKPQLITAEMVKPSSCVIDVGINRNTEGKLVGDVDYSAVQKVAGWVSPVPGGVGPMTIAMLLNNAIQSAQQGAELDADSPAEEHHFVPTNALDLMKMGADLV